MPPIHVPLACYSNSSDGDRNYTRMGDSGTILSHPQWSISAYSFFSTLHIADVLSFNLVSPLQNLLLPSHLSTAASWEDTDICMSQSPASIFSKTFHTLLACLLMKELVMQSPFNSRSSNGSNRVVQC